MFFRGTARKKKTVDYCTQTSVCDHIPLIIMMHFGYVSLDKRLFALAPIYIVLINYAGKIVIKCIGFCWSFFLFLSFVNSFIISLRY